MAYADARARIATVLATISITAPVTASIERVYTDPPEVVQDRPSFVMFGAEGQYNYTLGSGTINEEVETEHFQLFVHDDDKNRAAAIVRAFQVAVRAAFKNETGLDGHGVIRLLRWGRPSGLTFAGKQDFTGCDFFVEFLVLAP